MKAGKLFVALMLGSFSVCGFAQINGGALNGVSKFAEGRRLCDEGHYYAARHTLGEIPENIAVSGLKESDARDLEVMLLVCDYYLNSQNVASRIDDWLRENRVSPYRLRMKLFRANLYVKEGRFTESLSLYAECKTDSKNNPDAVEYISPYANSNIKAEERAEAVLYEAIANIGLNDFQEAKRLLTTVDDSPAHKNDIVYYRAYIKYVEQDYEGALSDFIEVVDCSEYRDKVPVFIADCYLNTGMPSEALATIDVFRAQCGITPFDAECTRIEGEAFYLNHDYANAVSKLTAYVDLVDEPKRTALYKLGMCHFAEKAYTKAAACLSRSAGVERDAMAQNAWYHAGVAYVNVFNSTQARMAFQQASEMNFDRKVQEEALYNYALALHEGGTMGFGESVEVFEKFLNTFPSSKYRSNVAAHLNEVYFTTQNYPRALASISKIKNPNNDILIAKQKVLYNLGTQDFLEGKYNDAVVRLNQSLSIGLDDQTSVDTYYWRGESEYRLGKLATAASDFKKYINSSKSVSSRNVVLANYSLGYILFKQKKYSDAQVWFERFFSVANKTDKKIISAIPNMKAMRADAYNRIGDCLFANRQYDEAFKAYQKALDADMSLGDYSLLQQAFICGLRGDYTTKVALLSRMDSVYSASQYGADALFERGRAFVQGNDKQNAVATFNSLIKRYPQSAYSRQALNELGLIEYESGNTDEAISVYKSVIEKYPNTPEAQTALSNLKDVFTATGRISEYATLAASVGRSLSADELDAMVHDAAIRALSDGDNKKAGQYYRQLREQTSSDDMRQKALEGELHTAMALADNASIISLADMMLQDAGKLSPSVSAETRYARSMAYLHTGNVDGALADWTQLSADPRTVYGAEAAVRLAQHSYESQQYQAAESLLLSFIDSGTPHAYWLARGFILLADVYSATDRKVEAREYLLSLKSSYSENEEINKMIEERLSVL